MIALKKSRVNRARRKDRPVPTLPWKKIATVVFGLSLMTSIVASLAWLADRPIAIEVVGPGQRVSDLEVQAALAQFDGKGFLSVDLDAVRGAAEALPWVDRARVQRAMPSKLRISVTEQVAAARWGDSGLLNTRGELFVENSRFPLPELPSLAGPAGSEWRVAQRYLQAYGQLTPLGFAVQSLQMNPRGAWNMQLANGVQIRLGRDPNGKRIERFAGFAAAVIQGQVERVSYVDMRYENGFAIGWKPGYDPSAQNVKSQG